MTTAQKIEQGIGWCLLAFLAAATFVRLVILEVDAAPKKCARCAEVLVLARPPEELCTGCQGGASSRVLFESFTACACQGACSDVCASACTPGADFLHAFDPFGATASCITCTERVAHAQVDPHGCGEVWQLCSADAP